MSSLLSRVLALCVAVVSVALAAAPAFPANNKGVFVVWERIEGITPVSNANAQLINGVYSPVGYPWTLSRGQAHVDLVSGRFKFSVKGLAIGAMPLLPPSSFSLSPIGTTGVVASVRGTFVCANAGFGVDTPAVELSPNGDAFLQGVLDYEFSCDPEDVIFLLRVVDVIDGAPGINGLWLAYGAGRSLQGRAP